MVIIVKGGEVTSGRNYAQVDNSGRIIKAVTRSGNKSTTRKSSKSWSRSSAETIEEAQNQTQVNKEVPTKTFNSQKDLDTYKAVADSFINDLNESNKRTYERKILEQQQANTNINSRNSYYNPTQASFIAGVERDYKEKYNKTPESFSNYNPVSKNNKRLDVEEGVRYAQLSGAKLNEDFFFASKEGKEFLYDNSIGLRKLLPTKESKETFLLGDEGVKRLVKYKELDSKNNNNKFIDKITPNIVKNRVQNKLLFFEEVSGEIKRRKENIALLDKYYSDKGIERTKNYSPFNPVRASKLGNNLFNGMINSNNVVYEQDLIKASNRAGWRDVGSSFKAGINYIKEVGISFDKDNSFDFKAGLINSFKNNEEIKYFADRKVVLGGSLSRPPDERELTGLKMIGYSASSVFTNAIPYIGAVGTEAVDIGLASKDYYRSWVNPTPYNKAINRMELVDVGADFLTAGFAPNINTNINTQVSINEAIKNSKVSSSSSSSFNQPLPPLNTAVSSEVGFSNSNNSVAELSFNAVNESITRLGMGFNSNFNFNNELDFNLPNLNMNKSEVGFKNNYKNTFNNEVDLNFNNNINLNNQFNNNFNNQFNNDFNNQFNNNFNNNFNYNFNTNFNNNFDFNLNLNTNSAKQNNKKQNLSFSGRSYTPFVKFGGLFAPISKSSKNINNAFNRASYFIDNGPEDTFAVSSSAFNFSGLDVKASKGYKKKRTNRGIIFTENKGFRKIKRVKL